MSDILQTNDLLNIVNKLYKDYVKENSYNGEPFISEEYNEILKLYALVHIAGNSENIAYELSRMRR